MTNAKKKETGDRANETAAEALAGDTEHAGWRPLLVEALPLLEWVAAHGSAAGPERQEAARRIIVQHYIAATRKPDIVKARKRSAS